MTGKGERTTWDLQADRDLLASMVSALSPSQDDLQVVRSRMHELGYTCTVKAITYSSRCSCFSFFHSLMFSLLILLFL